jgi:hypothetical protein
MRVGVGTAVLLDRCGECSVVWSRPFGGSRVGGVGRQRASVSGRPGLKEANQEVIRRGPLESRSLKRSRGKALRFGVDCGQEWKPRVRGLRCD